MKRSTFNSLLNLLTGWAVIFLLSSCNPENPLNQGNDPASLAGSAALKQAPPALSYAMTTSTVQLSNGMLAFSSQQEFEQVLTSLEALDNDGAYSDSILANMGFNVNDPADDDLEPESPALDAFEARFGFSSFRQAEIAREEAFLDMGKHPENIESSPVYDEYLQTVLNADKEVKVGNSIFKIIDPSLTVEITDSKSSSLTELRNMREWEIGERKNIKMHYSPTREGGIYSMGKMMPCFVNFQYTIGQNLTVDFHGTAFSGLSFPMPVFYWQWDFGDGSSHSGSGEYGQFPTHTYLAPGTYYVEVTASDGQGCTNTYGQTIEVNLPPLPICHILPFHWLVDDLDVDFTFYSEIPGYILTWDFGDGTLFGPTGDYSASHTYPNYGFFQVEMNVYHPVIGCQRTFKWWINVPDPIANGSCGFVGGSNTQTIIYNYDGGYHNRAMKCESWWDNWLWYHKLGSKTTNYRKKSNGKWKKTKAYRIRAALDGNAWKKNGGNCTSLINVNADSGYKSNKKKAKVTQGIGESFSVGYQSVHGLHWVLPSANENHITFSTPLWSD